MDCPGENISVTFVLIPLSEKYLQALIPGEIEKLKQTQSTEAKGLKVN